MTTNKLIKVCGMKEGSNIREAEQLGVDMIGFIFYAQSPRRINKVPAYLPQKAKRVGVFVNETETCIDEAAKRFSLDYIQLHGNESPAFCELLHKKGLHLIKAFSISDKTDLKQTEAYNGLCRYYLFDTACEAYGGSGKLFDWRILNHYTGETPFLLSGGIGPGSADRLSAFAHPKLAGYDINSRFESEPGKKEIHKIANFLKDIRQ